MAVKRTRREAQTHTLKRIQHEIDDYFGEMKRARGSGLRVGVPRSVRHTLHAIQRALMDLRAELEHSETE